jgi:DNA modification methylase
VVAREKVSEEMTWTIWPLDCRIGLPLLLPDKSVHCCVTSPPYFGLRNYDHPDQMGREATPDEFIIGMVAVFREVRRVLRDDGTLWLNIGDSYAGARAGSQGAGGQMANRSVAAARCREAANEIARGKRNAKRWGGGNNRHGGAVKNKDLIGIPWMLAFALRADGWYLRQDIIWSKPNAMPESVTDRCTKAHEYLFLLSKSKNYYFDDLAIAEPAAQPNRQRSDRFGGKKYDGSTTMHSDGSVFTGSKMRNRRSVWNVTTQPYKEAHFATFPPKLIEPCILAGCPIGGTVLDPFGGAGTTAMVAERLGRNSISFELNEGYVDIAERRIRASL